jgi:hypothetical protein
MKGNGHLGHYHGRFLHSIDGRLHVVLAKRGATSEKRIGSLVEVMMTSYQSPAVHVPMGETYISVAII